MEFINETIGRIFVLTAMAIAAATMVGQKLAEKYPGDARRLQVQAGATLAGWLKKWLK